MWKAGALGLAGLALHPALAQSNKPATQKNCEIKALDDKGCATQSATPPPSSAPTPAAQQFPYPGDASAPAQGTPAAPTPDASRAGKQFPYPGDVAPTVGSSSSNSSSTSSSSSSSSSSGSAADPDDPLDPGSATAQPPGRRKLPKVTNLQNDDDREAEDVKVARFYRDDGNNLAAYNRLKDATKLISDDADAWYLLGQVAAKMNKPQESLSAYQRFLKLEPDTHRAKVLAKTLSEEQAKR